MKEFRTEIRVAPSKLSMTLESKVLTVGSCFADAIGGRLVDYKLPALANPFGATYNPLSIHKVLEYSLFNELPPAHTYLRHDDVHLNYDFHSVLSGLSNKGLISRLSDTIGTTHYFLKDARWLIITYGTAWVYHRTDTGEVVANCHKMPAAAFEKSLVSTEAVVSSFEKMYTALKHSNPGIRILLTLSPVRHLKDTLELNSVSKAILRVACHEIAGHCDDVEYFPAYEMMMDDLRDYRFYKADMLHPTAQAEDYIWEKFMEQYFSRDLQEFARKWNAVLTALQHRPFHPRSAGHQQFLRETLRKLEAFRPQVDVEKEIEQIKQQISNHQE